MLHYRCRLVLCIKLCRALQDFNPFSFLVIYLVSTVLIIWKIIIQFDVQYVFLYGGDALIGLHGHSLLPPEASIVLLCKHLQIRFLRHICHARPIYTNSFHVYRVLEAFLLLVWIYHILFIIELLLCETFYACRLLKAV